MMHALLQSYGDGRVGEAVAAYRQHYGESGLLGSEPYPGIGRSLEEMKRAGLGIYLATSKRVTFASHEFDADLGRLFVELRFWSSDNQWWSDRKLSPETIPVPAKPPRL